MPFTGRDEVSRVKVSDIKYPGEVLRKWDNFFRISYKWKNYNGNRMAMDYCDDIWSDAAAWNGGNILWADTWAAASYFKGNLDFSYDNWVNYHEINHYFEDYQDPFNVRDHGWTNIPTVIDLSFINDKTRERNTLTSNDEYNDGWSRLAEPWGIANTYTDWYGMYASMVYNLGPLNFIEATKYVGYVGARNNLPKAAVAYSDYFKLDVRYALSGFLYLPEHNKNFNQVINSVSAEDRAKIEKYPAFDFVGNLYAAGQYLNTSGKTGQDTYEYNGDALPAFEIAAGQPFVFQFDKFIRSPNPKFKWDRLSVTETSKLGGTLEVINGGKQVRYTASNNKLEENDEFDLTIYPGSWDGKPQNYVKSYKFKIKIRNVVNRQHIKIIKGEELKKHNIPLNSIDAIAKSVLPKIENNTIVSHDMIKDYDGTNFLNRNRGDLMLSEFIIKTPDLGTYIFNWSKGMSWFKIDIQKDGQGAWEEVFKKNDVLADNDSLKAGFLNITGNYEFVKVRIWYYNRHDNRNFNIWMSRREPGRNGAETKGYDLNTVVYSPYINNLEPDFRNWDKFRDDAIYGYKRRFLPEDQRDQLEYKKFVPKVATKPSGYTVTGVDKSGTAGFDKVFDGSESTRLEYWGDATVVANLTYPKKETLNYILFKRWNNHKNWFIRSLKVEAKMEDGSYKTVVNWTGRGKDLPDWWALYFSEIVMTNEVRITMASSNEAGKSAMIISLMELGDDLRVPNAVVAANNTNNEFRGTWELKENDANTVNSYINGVSAYTTTANSSITFNVVGNQFSIIGKSADNLGKFDVYVDDKLVGVDVSAASKIANFNKMLFFASLGENGKHKVTIVAKENKPIYINYLATSDK
ncbi:hypothetical protein ACJA23_03225 [Mycoplasma corogypsi]|uniref:hypothetical protein n=1 Tax=Mycoplasma corogypsi TaxID=2106 RepID=UPI0038738E2C